MAINRSDPEENYTKLPNRLLRGGGDRNDYARKDGLKPEAIGVLVYLLSHTDRFQVTVNAIAGHWRISRERARRIMRDLEAAGYARRATLRSDSGQIECWDFEVTDTPDAAKTRSGETQKKQKPEVDFRTQIKTNKKRKTNSKESNATLIADAITRCPNGVDAQAFQTWLENKAYRGSITDAKLANCVATFEALRKSQCSDYRRAVNIAIEKGWHSIEPHYTGIKQLCAVQEKPQSDRENILLAVVK